VFFAPIAEELGAKEEQILAELAAAQGPAAEIGGYYRPSVELKAEVMRPSATLNAIIG
ncbi:MAG: NADP-dependent isocitrate dehydrogenase, partial [Leisingera sp.]